ncbi:hypothetical protein [Streptomyces sp. S465]|uniref:hypothetical protein n=1 Tax=Streptomyces sp. S465 TaxID=2979468 RepID=UPI0022A89386|nr:hypothetical protein [Streptomyces sp. S465]WAP53560.1 hypothetical protein N6H00_00550 [Streptomyces sp. S465]
MRPRRRPRGRYSGQLISPKRAASHNVVYQGKGPNSGGDYSQFPYCLGPLTRTGNSC